MATKSGKFFAETRPQWPLMSPLRAARRERRVEVTLLGLSWARSGHAAHLRAGLFVRCDAKTCVARLLYRREANGPKGPRAADIELMRAFYEKYFDAQSTQKYGNERKRFTSYFLTFPGGWRLELMHRPDIQKPSTPLQNDCRATGSRFSMGQDGPATDTTRAWSRIPKVTGLLSPNESAGPQLRCGAPSATVRPPDRGVTL
jgi:hypothetical protein